MRQYTAGDLVIQSPSVSPAGTLVQPVSSQSMSVSPAGTSFQSVNSQSPSVSPAGTFVQTVNSGNDAAARRASVPLDSGGPVAAVPVAVAAQPAASAVSAPKGVIIQRGTVFPSPLTQPNNTTTDAVVQRSSVPVDLGYPVMVAQVAVTAQPAASTPTTSKVVVARQYTAQDLVIQHVNTTPNSSSQSINSGKDAAARRASVPVELNGPVAAVPVAVRAQPAASAGSPAKDMASLESFIQQAALCGSAPVELGYSELGYPVAAAPAVVAAQPAASVASVSNPALASILKGSSIQRQHTAGSLAGQSAIVSSESSAMKVDVFEKLFHEACHDDPSRQSISRDELPMAMGLLQATGSMGPMAAGLLRNADSNRDGVLTRVEWDTYTKYLKGAYPPEIIVKLEEAVSKADLPSIRQRLQDARSRLPSGWVWCANAQSLGQHTYEHRDRGLKASTLEEAIATDQTKLHTAKVAFRASCKDGDGDAGPSDAASRASRSLLDGAAKVKTVRPPPGFTMVPSKVVPGRYVFHDPGTQISFVTLDEAWMVYEKQQAKIRDTPAANYMKMSKTISQKSFSRTFSRQCSRITRRSSDRYSQRSSLASLGRSGDSLRDIVLSKQAKASKRGTMLQSTRFASMEASPQALISLDMSLDSLGSSQPLELDITHQRSRLKSAAATVPDPGQDGGFVDASFPPCDGSFGVAQHNRPFVSEEQRAATRWIRLPELLRLNGDLMPTDEEWEAGAEDEFEVELHADVEPNCPTQGLHGNCWLIASMAALAEFPDAIRNLFVSQAVSEDGQYMVRLFDMNRGEWEEIVLDDYVPCIYQADYTDIPCTFDEATGKKVFREEYLFNLDGSSKVPRKWIPHFAKPAKRQLWAPLLEKAMAKFVGSYGSIAGGNEAYALTALTGFPIVYCFRRPSVVADGDVRDNSRATPGVWEWCGAQFIRRDETAPNLERLHGVDALGDGMLWDKLSDYDSRNFVITASITKFAIAADKPALFSIVRADGLVNGHAYSLISCRVAQRPDGEEVRFMLLRNPHGEGQAREDGVHNTEWAGDWCDTSPLWDEHPDVARQVGFEPIYDGFFWMSCQDFARIFDKVFVLPRAQEQPRGQVAFIRRQEHRAEVCMALRSMAEDEPGVRADLRSLTIAFDPYAEMPDFLNDGTHETRLRWEATKPGRLQGWLDLNRNAGNEAGYNYIASKVKALGLESALGPSGHIAA